MSTSVEGTAWLTRDECSRSQVVVTQGRVRVRNLVTRRTRTIRAGGRYTRHRPAPPPSRLRNPLRGCRFSTPWVGSTRGPRRRVSALGREARLESTDARGLGPSPRNLGRPPRIHGRYPRGRPNGTPDGMPASAIFPRMPDPGRRLRVLLPARREPLRSGRGVDQVHGPQAPRGASARFRVVHRVRRPAGASVHAQAHQLAAGRPAPAVGSRSAPPSRAAELRAGRTPPACCGPATVGAELPPACAGTAPPAPGVAVPRPSCPAPS